MTTYKKPHLSYSEQIELLKSRGLIIPDIHYATLKLKHISYYRLSAYFLPFYTDKEVFQSDTTFEKIIDVYHFDKELRSLTFNAIEKIEIFLRTSVSYNLSKEHGAFGYMNKENLCLHKKDDYTWLIKDLTKEMKRSKETFVKHFKTKYKQEELPIWMVVEIISFGTLSKLYSLLCPGTQKEILNEVNLPSSIFKNWLHVFSYVRNTSAHHSRLWNRQFVIKAKIPKHKKEFKGLVNDKYITFAFMSSYILESINDTFDYKQKLIELFEKYPNIDFSKMGFSDDWKNSKMWGKDENI